MTVLMALSTIATEQAIATERTLAKGTQMMDYLVHNATAKVRFHASDMIMNIHLDSSYPSEVKACSRTCSHFFMGWQPADGEPIRINGVFHVSANILLLKLNLVLYTKISRLASSFVGLLKPWVTSNPKHLCIAIMPLWWASPITLLNNNVQDRWKCTFSGSVTRWHKICTYSAGTQAKRTCLITKASIMWAPIMWLFALGTCTWMIPPRNS
jgi:hypothetical protein